jgi:hypothetical protein
MELYESFIGRFDGSLYTPLLHEGAVLIQGWRILIAASSRYLADKKAGDWIDERLTRMCNDDMINEKFRLRVTKSKCCLL